MEPSNPTPTNPTWPRYFTLASGYTNGVAYVRADSPHLIFIVYVDGFEVPSVSHSIEDCEKLVADGIWREITATEAAEMVAERSKQ